MIKRRDHNVALTLATQYTCQEAKIRDRALYKVAVISKSVLIREGLKRMLRRAGLAIVASAATLDYSTFRNVPDEHSVLLLIDGCDAGSAIAQIELFRSTRANARIAVVADQYDFNHVLAFLRAGANGCFLQSVSFEEFWRFIELIMIGETIVPYSVVRSTASTGSPQV